MEKLHQVSQQVPQQMGFKASATSSGRKMLLIVSLLPDEVNLIVKEDNHEVDAILFSTVILEKNALPQLSKTMKDIPWGLALGRESKIEVSQWKKAGCDFILFDPTQTPASLAKHPDIEEMGRVAITQPQWGDGLLRSIERSRIDALLLHMEEGLLPTVYQVMLCQRITYLTKRPLFVNVSEELDSDSIQALREAGVSGLILQAEEKGQENKKVIIAHLSQNIAALPSRVKGSSGTKREVALPLVNPEEEPEVW